MGSVRRCCIRKGTQGECGNAVEDWMDYAVCLPHAAKIRASIRIGMQHLSEVEHRERVAQDTRQGYVYYLRNGDRVKDDGDGTRASSHVPLISDSVRS